MDDFTKELNELVKLYNEKGYEIVEHHVHVTKLKNKVQRVTLKSNNFKNNGRVYEVIYRNYSDYETAYVSFKNEKPAQNLVEKLTIDHKGCINHTLSAFNIPYTRIMDSIEIQAELTVIATELASYIIELEKESTKLTRLADLV